MPAMNNILSKWVPVSERSRSLALVYSGMYLGSVTGLAFSPFLIHKFGWPSVFYSFGSLGTVWFATWATKVLKYPLRITLRFLWYCCAHVWICGPFFKAYSTPLEDPGISAKEKKLLMSQTTSGDPVTTIPWGVILSKPPVWALIACHFCHNWGTFILLTWMPTYYNQVSSASCFSTEHHVLQAPLFMKTNLLWNRFWNSTLRSPAFSVSFPG
jgi:ACS family sodium-dependent inorganic phosphate cotransporter